MSQDNVALKKKKRGRPSTNIKTERMFFVLETDLKQQIHELAEANFISESQFVRESIRRNIAAYKQAKER